LKEEPKYIRGNWIAWEIDKSEAVIADFEKDHHKLRTITLILPSTKSVVLVRQELSLDDDGKWRGHIAVCDPTSDWSKPSDDMLEGLISRNLLIGQAGGPGDDEDATDSPQDDDDDDPILDPEVWGGVL